MQGLELLIKKLQLRNTIRVFLAAFVLVSAIGAHAENENLREKEISSTTYIVTGSQEIDRGVLAFENSLPSQPNITGTFARLRHSLKNSKVGIVHFTKESASFFVAIAAVQLEQLLVNYSDNPIALQQHLESLTDPVANASFYMFMVANRFTVNFLNTGNKALDPLAKAQAFRSISYSGMMAGSLASSLTADILSSMTACGKFMFSSKNEDKEEADRICDGALKQWTLSSKAQQYIPQIISLLASTEISQFVELKGAQAISYTSKTAWAKALAANAKSAFAVTGINLATASAQGPVIKGVQIVGKVAQFAGFTYIDHMIAPFITKGFANLWKPASFDFNAKDFNKAVLQSKNSNWTDQESNQKLAEELTSISEAMKSWREAQLAKFYSSHAAWGETILNMVEQTNTTYGFYKEYLDNLFSTYKVRHRIQHGALPATAMNHESNFPFRTLPLYGIKLLTTLPDDYDTAEDLMLNNPSDLESHQIETVRFANNLLKIYLQNNAVNSVDAILLKELVKALDSSNLQIVGQGLAKINDVFLNRQVVLNPDIRALILKVRSSLGNPYPILFEGMGFSYAYTAHSFNTAAMKGMKKPSGPGDSLPRTSDYLMVQMACGAEHKFYKSRWGFAPSFTPPRVIINRLDIPQLCEAQDLRGDNENGLGQINIHSRPFMTSDGKRMNGVNDVITKNIRLDILGDYRDPQAQPNFTKWWNANVNPQLFDLYHQLDRAYVPVIAKMTQNWSGTSSVIDGTLDKLNGSDYLERDVLKNLSFELKIYTAVLNELILDTSKQNRPVEKTTDFLGFLRRLKANDISIVKGRNINQIKEISDLVAAIESRLSILRNVQVLESENKILNFPDKDQAKAAMEAVSVSLEALTKLVDFKNQNKSISGNQLLIAKSALAGIQSVIAEVSSLNMALYTTKYKISDRYEDIISALKHESQNGTKPKTPGFNPRGG